MKKLTLKQLLEIGKRAPVDGDFGIKECKEEIVRFLEMCKDYGEEKSLYKLLEIYVDRANTNDLIYHATNVYACWQLINEN